MAVTLTADDLIQPAGELSNDFFPLGDLADHIDGWLAAAVTRVEGNSDITSTRHNDAAAAYVYYRAYDYIANQLAALPNNQSEGDGAIEVSIAVTQFRYFQDKAASKWAAYGGYIVVGAGPFFFTTVQGQRGR